MKIPPFLLILIFLIGCEPEPQPETKEDPTKAEQGSLYEGDVIIHEDGDILPYKSGGMVKAAVKTKGLWINNIVYYSIDPNLPMQYRVHDAIAEWEKYTNLKFVERTTEANYVYFTIGGGCSSYIGMIGGRQSVTLSNSCTTGNTIHEIGHAVGMWHEHSRADRDNHITVNYTNIRAGYEYNFRTHSELDWTNSSIDATTNLDFGSIMMYGAYAFTSNGLPAITKKDGSTYRVQRYALSEGDIEGVSKIYPVSGEPEFVNGKLYSLYGLTVLRYNDLWYYRTKYGYKRVELRPRGDSYAWYWV